MKIKKILLFLFGVLIGLGFTVAAGLFVYKTYKHAKTPKRYDAWPAVAQLQGPNIQDDRKVFVASSLDRIFLDGMTLEKPAYATAASISAARHEYESFQVVVYSKDKDIESVRFEFSDLIDARTKAVLPAKTIGWRKVGYVETGEPYYPVKFVGLWSDPLIPMQSASVKAGETQPFWLTAYVPENAVPGNYTGAVKVIADGTSHEIPISLKVYSFALPLYSSLKTAFDFYGHITKLRYPQGEKESDEAWRARIGEINERFIVMMLKYRMNPILNIDPTVPAELGRVDYYRRYGLNNFSIGRRGGTFNNNWPTDEESINNFAGLYRTYAELLKLNGMIQDTYIYSWDEGEVGNPIVQWVTGMIRRAHPELKNMVCYHGFWDPKKHPDWGKFIDIWVFNNDDFKEDALRTMQKMGIEMWMYISGPSGFGSPNLAIDFDSTGYRVIPWLCWKYDLKGFLYWCVNWWEKADPFETAVNTDWGQNGNGLLFYPGPNGPLASIRTELYRDGMEDYEYIQILMKKIKELKILKLEDRFSREIADSIAAMTVDPAIAASMFEYNHEGETLKLRRNQIADKIEQLSRLITDVQADTKRTPIQP
jgi:hypothetical protein